MYCHKVCRVTRHVVYLSNLLLWKRPCHTRHCLVICKISIESGAPKDQLYAHRAVMWHSVKANPLHVRLCKEGGPAGSLIGLMYFATNKRSTSS